jgi:nucleoside recognition membrane protein YjiH
MQVENNRGVAEHSAKAEAEIETITATNLLKFIIPSLLGFGLFLTPIRYQGNATVVLGVLAGQIQAAVGPSMKYATVRRQKLSDFWAMFLSQVRSPNIWK